MFFFFFFKKTTLWNYKNHLVKHETKVGRFLHTTSCVCDTLGAGGNTHSTHTWPAGVWKQSHMDWQAVRQLCVCVCVEGI